MSRHPINDEALLAYALGELDADAAAELEAALASVPGVRADLARITAMIDTMRSDRSEAPPPAMVTRAKAIFRRRAATAPAWLDRLTAIVAECIFDSRRDVALAGVRGDEEGIQLAFETADAEVDLQAEPAGNGRWRVIGQVAEGNADVEVMVTARGSLEPLVCVAADDHGLFTLEVDPGTFDVRVRLDDARMVILPEIRIA